MRALLIGFCLVLMGGSMTVAGELMIEDLTEGSGQTAAAGDNVLVELTPYDLSKGRITFRYK